MSCNCSPSTSNCGCSNPVSLLSNLSGPTGAKGDTGATGASGTSVLYNKYFDGSINDIYSNEVGTTIQQTLMSDAGIPEPLIYTLPASTISDEGDFIEIECRLLIGALGNDEQLNNSLQITFGGTTILNYNFSNNQKSVLLLKARISVANTTTQRINTYVTVCGFPDYNMTFPHVSQAKTLTNPLDITIDCTTTHADNAAVVNLVKAENLCITKYLV
jgi:hypothetical protein